MLYALEQDPDGNVNVAGRPEYTQIAEALAALLNGRQAEAQQSGKKPDRRPELSWETGFSRGRTRHGGSRIGTMMTATIMTRMVNGTPMRTKSPKR
jgi:hypothetical protein